jgi:hypothetical protein
MADVSANAISTEAKSPLIQEEPKKEDEKQEGQNPNPNPFDMRICITGGAGSDLFGASARMAGALAPKSNIKKTPKADIF